MLFETGLSVMPNSFDSCFTSGPFVVPFLSSVTLDQMSTSSGPVSGVFLSLKWFLEGRGVCS